MFYLWYLEFVFSDLLIQKGKEKEDIMARPAVILE